MNTQTTSLFQKRTSISMKKILLSFLLILFNYLLVLAQPTFIITPSVTGTVPVGTLVTFDVTVENYDDIISNQFAISWDTNVLDFVIYR